MIRPTLLVVGNLGLQVIGVLKVGGTMLHILGCLSGGSAYRIAWLLFLDSIVLLLGAALLGERPLRVGTRNKKRYMSGHKDTGDR